MELENNRTITEEEIEDTLEYIKMTEPQQFDFSDVIECNHCYFEKICFTDFNFRNISCYDVVFKNCDFSNVVWNTNAEFAGPYLHKVTFDNCKMVGTDFGMTTIKKVAFQNCVGRYVNFSFVTMKEVKIISCSFQNMILQDSNCKKLVLQDNELLDLELLHTSLKDVDMTSNHMEGLKTDLESIRGMIVNPEQALQLSGLLGIIVKSL